MSDEWLDGKLQVIEEVAKSINHVEGKYRCIMDIARTLSMEEIQVLEKMLLDLWCDKLKKLSEKNDAAQ